MRYRNEAHTTPESATRGMGNTHIVERTENTDLLSNVCVCDWANKCTFGVRDDRSPRNE